MRLRSFIFLLIGASIIGGLVYNIGLEEVANKLSDVDPFFFLLAFTLSLLTIVIKMTRWSGIFPEVRPVEAWKIYLIGQAINQGAPTGSGELTRALVAKSEFKVPVAKVLAPAMVERISDTTFLFSMTVLLLLVFFEDSPFYMFPIVGISFVVLSLGYYAILRPSLLDLLAKKLEGFGKKRQGFLRKILTKVSGLILRVKESLFLFRQNMEVIYRTIAFTVVAWVFYGLGFYALVKGMDEDMGRYGFISAIAVVAASEIIGSFSFLPGGLGAKEGAITVFLELWYGIPAETGLALSLLWRFIAYSQLGSGALFSMASFPRLDQEVANNG